MQWQAIWKRLAAGRHAAILGVESAFPENPEVVVPVTIDCAFFRQPRGALVEAQRGLLRLSSEPSNPLLEAARRRLESGLRRHLIGESDEDADLRRVLELFRAASDACRRPVCLVFRSVDQAEPELHALLLSLARRQGALAVPLLLGFDAARPEGKAASFLEATQELLGSDGVFRSDVESATEEQERPAPLDTTKKRGEASAIPQHLPSSTLLVLRAAATAGDLFESSVLARLLNMDEVAVIGHLQRAVDSGAAIEDRGARRFRLPGGLAAELRQGTLPSLEQIWHERLAALLGGLPAPPHPHPEAAVAPAVPAPSAARREESETPPEPVPPLESRSAKTPEEPESSTATSPNEQSGREARGAAATPDVLEPNSSQETRSVEERREPWWQDLERAMREQVRPAPEPSVVGDVKPLEPAPRPQREAPSRVDAPRAAHHAEAAGQWQVACEQHLEAGRAACAAGEYGPALRHAERALSLAERVSAEEVQRRSCAAALALIGQVRWRALGPGQEFTLEGALDALEQARSLLRPEDPLQLRAEVSTLIANVQFEMGTPNSLESALQELTKTSRQLLAAGFPLEAARLLNDEAAVWVKIGDPVRANGLLSRSREVFSKVALSFEPARLELAETEHLLARLMLSARARPGREQEALRIGLEHAQVAEEVYRELHDALHLARVLETLGRLELRLGHLDSAEQRLGQARQVQEEIGDGLGLARSSAALCELFTARGDAQAALRMLAQSIEFNLEKGSRAGLRFNLEGLQELAPRLPAALHDAARQLERRLGAGLQGLAGNGGG